MVRTGPPEGVSLCQTHDEEGSSEASYRLVVGAGEFALHTRGAAALIVLYDLSSGAL